MTQMADDPVAARVLRPGALCGHVVPGDRARALCAAPGRAPWTRCRRSTTPSRPRAEEAMSYSTSSPLDDMPDDAREPAAPPLLHGHGLVPGRVLGAGPTCPTPAPPTWTCWSSPAPEPSAGPVTRGSAQPITASTRGRRRDGAVVVALVVEEQADADQTRPARGRRCRRRGTGPTLPRARNITCQLWTCSRRVPASSAARSMRRRLEHDVLGPDVQRGVGRRELHPELGQHPMAVGPPCGPEDLPQRRQVRRVLDHEAASLDVHPLEALRVASRWWRPARR